MRIVDRFKGRLPRGKKVFSPIELDGLNDTASPLLETKSHDPFQSSCSLNSSNADNHTYAPSNTTTIDLDAHDGNSPYSEVRTSVPNYDDESMAQNTVRMWVIGLLLMTAATAMNTVFFIHDPPFIVTPYIIIVIAWPIGWIWERIVPNIWGLNPGPFTYKEHVLISVLAAASTLTLTSDTVISLTSFYEKEPLGSSIPFVLLMNWGASLAGMAIVGPLKRILVEPAEMLWPTQLVTVTLISNIHIKWNHVANGWHITRKRFFWISTVICALYSFAVHFFAKFLSHFSLATWISPHNYIVNQLFGTFSGAGAMPITFDWNILSGFLNSPLVPTARVFVNAGLALVITVWVITTGIHYSNVWWGRYVPFSTAHVYDRFGSMYHVTKIVKDNFKLDEQQYHNYSPLFLSTTRLMNFGMGLAGSISLLVHTILFDSSGIYNSFRKKPDDIHAVLMRKYKPVPMWWYGLLFILGTAIMFINVLAFDTHVYAWYPILALAIGSIWMLPVTYLCACTTLKLNVEALSLLLTGYMNPGNVVAMVMFKNFVVSSLSAGVLYMSLVKLGHYTKIRPKLIFIVRFVAILWSGALQAVILVKVNPLIKNECQVNEYSGFACTQAHFFFTDAIAWGIIGSKQMMLLYGELIHFLWIGALLPIALWLYLKKWPRSKLSVIHSSLFFNAFDKIPPAAPYNYACWVIVGIMFSHWIRRYWHSWWAKYCYTLSAALDFGLAAEELFYFIIYAATKNIGPNWWGNVGYRENIDGRFEPMKRPEKGAAFGPRTW